MMEKRSLVSVIAVLLFLVVLSPVALSAVCPAGYDYYVNKTLTERSGVALPNHAVEFTMDTAALISGGKMNASACGVYIKGVDGTALPSWIVDGTCNKAATRIFTKIPRLTASGNYKINVCYGNLTAPIYSNDMNRIFAYGDNFNSGTAINTSTWVRFCYDTGTVSTNIINGTVNITSRYEDSDYCGYRLANANLPNYYSEIKFKPVASGSDEVKMRISTSAGDGGSWIRDRHDANAVEVDGGTTLRTQAANITVSNSTTGIGAVWQRAVFMGNTSGSVDKAETRVYNDGTNALLNRVKATLAAGGAGSAFGYIALWRAASAPSEMKKPNGFYDYVFSKNFTGSLGTEPNVSYSSGELPSSDPCALNPTGNTALAASAVCSGDLGSTTGNITINDGVAIEFRNAIISLTGANASISVEGSVIFNRTTIRRTPTSSRDGWTMETKNADAPIRIYKSYFDQLRRARVDKDNSYIDGIYLNSSTGVGTFNAYGMVFSRVRNITLANATTFYPTGFYSFTFNLTNDVTIQNLIGEGCAAASVGQCAPLYLHRSCNRTVIKGFTAYRTNYGIQIGADTHKLITIQDASFFYPRAASIPIYYQGTTGVRLDGFLAERIIVVKNMSVNTIPNYGIMLGSGQITNCTVKNAVLTDLVSHSTRWYPPYSFVNVSKSGYCDFTNVTDYNSTANSNTNYPYNVFQTATLKSSIITHWYFQPNISVNGVPLSGGNISLHSRFGDTSFLTEANGVPLGTQANLVFSANVSGTTVLRHLYNVSIYNSSGSLIYTKENLMINNSNWNRDIDISGEMSVVMNSLGGTNTTSLSANFSYTPTSTRTESGIAECNLTLNGSIVGTDVSILNDTAQIFTHNFTELDNNKCFSVAVTCRTDAEPYSIGQSVPINYCLAIPAAAGYVQQFGIEGIIGGAIDATAGLLAGFASMSENLGAMAALALVILLISGMIGVLLLAIWSKVKKW